MSNKAADAVKPVLLRILRNIGALLIDSGRLVRLVGQAIPWSILIALVTLALAVLERVILAGYLDPMFK